MTVILHKVGFTGKLHVKVNRNQGIDFQYKVDELVSIRCEHCLKRVKSSRRIHRLFPNSVILKKCKPTKIFHYVNKVN